LYCLCYNDDLENKDPLQQNVVPQAAEACDVSELKMVPLDETVAVVHA